MASSYLTTKVCGGLGNQLFQIAAMFRIKQDVPEVTIVFHSFDDDRKDRPRGWNRFLADCSVIQELLVNELPKVNWDKLAGFETCFTFHNFISPVRRNCRSGKSTRIDNCFQNIRYLPEKPFLLKLFNIEEKQKYVQNKTQFITEGSCSLHFRLGDYKGLSHIHTVLSDDYYRRALAKLDLSSIKRIYIFNELEDQQQVENRVQRFNIPPEIQVIYVTKTFDLKEDWESMILMSLCEFNIIANSTFSWWGAYFNKFFNVIYPEPVSTPWVRVKDINHFNMFFPGWSAV